MATKRLEQTKDGRWYYRIRVSRGRSLPPIERRWYVPAGWSDKAILRQLDKEAAELERAVKAGEITTRREQREQEAAEAKARAEEEARTYTVRRFCEEVFLPMKEVELTATSMAPTRGILHNWLFPSLGDVKLADVSPAMLTTIMLDAQRQGKRFATLQNIYRTVNAVFAQAEYMDLIVVNPMRKVRKPRRSKDEQNRKHALTKEQLQIIIDALNKEPLMWQCLVRTLLDTGCRRGEAVALQWGDVDISSGAVSITKQMVYVSGEGTNLTATKTGQNRSVYLSKETCQLLQRLHQEQEQVNESPNYIFCSDYIEGKPVVPNSVTDKVRSLGQSCGIEGLTPHILRHSWASLALEAGADVLSVSRNLGHSTPATTLSVYAHPSDEGAKAAAQKFRESIGEE